MAIESNNLKNVENELSLLGNALAEVQKAMAEIDAAIAAHNTDPAILEEKLNKLSLDLKNISIGQQETETEVDNLGEKYWVIFMDMLNQKLCHLGCNVVPVEDPTKILFSIDFGKGFSIIIQVKHTHISLVEMSPVNPNFANIKKHLDETQDLMGLLIHMATMD